MVRDPLNDEPHRIKDIRVTPVAFRDPPLLNTVGVHEPFALRAVVEVVTESGLLGLGETYGTWPIWSGCGSRPGS